MKPTQAKLAAALGVTRSRVSQLVKAGMPDHGIEAAQAWKIQHVAPMMIRKIAPALAPLAGVSDAAAPGLVATGPSYETSRAKREAAEASIAAMREAELAGLLIRVDAIRAAWAAKITGARDALLQIPSRIAPVLAAESDLVRVTALLEDELRQALADLSRDALPA